ncbi:MAG: site-2 protease family protein [Planctomycetales bacterium]|nr:site-2 protease family protein [Planctomycetales bacterium]
MNESISWTVGLGRWRGVHVRVHLLLVAFGVSLLWWGASGEPRSWAYGPICVAVLAVSVWSREAARLCVARHCGSDANLIVLWPMGGWLAGDAVDERRGALAVALAPSLLSMALTTVGAAVFAAIVVSGAVWEDPASVTDGLVAWLPPSPTLLEAGGLWTAALAGLATAAALLAWLNAALLVINLLPVGALDGGHVLRAIVRDPQRPERGERIMGRIAVATSVALGVLGWYAWSVQPAAAVALWLVALGMCRRERCEDASAENTQPRRGGRRALCHDTPSRVRTCGSQLVGCRTALIACGSGNVPVKACAVPRHALAESSEPNATAVQRANWLGTTAAAIRTRIFRPGLRRGRRWL